jgi:multisubunit Na+/H+ antiporter MnhB subunit
MSDALTRFTADLILGVTWVIAWQQIMYADELPGDGFTAGVFVLVAILLQHVVLGRHEATEKLPPQAFFAAALVGVAMLCLLFVVPMTWGGHPLQHFYVPLGPVALSSTTLFDLGIFLAIAGALVAGITSVQESPE